ncbi:unnamed protein product [Nippostrongylus brasiliensis]|uniref:Calcium uniporter protein n=1 Tax=Nippostrongylus brasiliensis TaxID=27835 RepID=A0A0N4XUA3_NIPBR|nr:unnamed protein product [Nippostrongylus brasiliensis]
MRFCTATPSPVAAHSTIDVRFERGLPLLSVTLPSRQESCQFSLRPLTDDVGSFCEQLKREDHGIDYVAVYTNGGIRVATSTSIEHLLHFGGFRLRLNDRYYDVIVPKEQMELDVGREKRMIEQLERAETELRPLQEQKLQIEKECEAHTERVMWAGFAAMGIQTGLFARLTWWEYSWDIMEPVTYFATYATVVATFGYYLYTRQTFEYPTARSRIFTKQFYRRAVREGFDIEKYNKLATEVGIPVRFRTQIIRSDSFSQK